MYHRLILLLIVAVGAMAFFAYSHTPRATTAADPLQFNRELGKLLNAADELVDACQRNWRACSNRAEALAAERNHLARWKQLREKKLAVRIPRDDNVAVDFYTAVSQLLDLGLQREATCLQLVERVASDAEFVAEKQKLRPPGDRRWQRMRERTAQTRKHFRTTHQLHVADG